MAECRGLDDRARRWVREATYGTIRLRGRLDHLLALHLTQGLAAVHDDLLQVLRLGAYQVLYMRGVPDYAAISQAVDQARAAGQPRAAGLVNAVLRGLAREGGGPERFPSMAREPLEHMARWGSHPLWMVERWVKRFGVEETASLISRNNEIPPIAVRPIGASVPGTLEKARALLEFSGVMVSEVLADAGVLVLREPSQLQAALAAGRFQVQDPGAALVVRYAAPPVAEAGWIGDFCSAPGGKAVGLSETGNPVLALDPSLRRLTLVAETAKRLNLPVYPVQGRAEAPPIESARLVLLDVPCSGTGTLRRHPDARWRLRLEDIDNFVRLQSRILEGGAAAVEKGGLLIYSTCTLEPEENRNQIETFLSSNPDFRVEGPEAWMAVSPNEYLDDLGFLEVLPQVHGHDGAFGARMRRVR